MKVTFFRSAGLLFGLFLTFTGYSQSGSWHPAGAMAGFPRTLTTAQALPDMRSSLGQPERQQIYNYVYGSAFSAVPAANSTSTDRRQRARLAKNAAFVFLTDRQQGAAVTVPLTAQQKNDLKAKTKTLLANANVAVESAYQNTEWQWRSKELIDYLIAYDLLRGGGLPADSLIAEKARLQQFTTNLYTNSTQNLFLYGVFFNNVKNNHALMTAAALGMAAIVLNDATSTSSAGQPQNWINAAMFHTDNVLWRDARRQSIPGVVAGYAEGPYYFKYAFQNLLPFFRAMGHFLPDGSRNYTWGTTTRNIRNPYFDPNYDLLYEWAAAISLPDGRLPALEDSYIDQAMPELALTGKSRFVKPLWLQNLPYQSAALVNQLDGTVDMRAAWLAANVAPTPASDTLVALPAAGNLVFRSGTGHNANYLQLYGKNGPMLNNSGGHNQADAASFQLYGHGQLLALDPGYLSYGSRTELGNAANHNMILVNGAGPAIGTAGVANDAEAFIENTFGDQHLMYGEVRTAYQGATIKRKAISIRGEYFVLADAVSSAQSRTYTWQLHGYGLENGTAATGTFEPEYGSHKGLWQKNGAALAAHVTATDGTAAYSTTTGVHEIGYENRENHSVMLVQKTAPATEFVSVLQPYGQQGPNAVASLSLPGVAGAVVTAAAGPELVLVKADTASYQLLSPAFAPVTTDAQLTFAAADADGMPRQWLINEGRQLALNGQVLLQSSKRANISWAEVDQTTGKGYSSRAAVVQLRTAGFPVAVNGPGVHSWSNTGNGLIEIKLSQPGYFQVQYSQAPLPVELMWYTAKREQQHALLEWQTATETDNAGFEIEVSADGTDFSSLSKLSPAQSGTAAGRHYRFTDTTPGKTGTRYYRLLQHDLDGSITSLGIRAVDFGTQPDVLAEAFPNPFSGSFTVRVQNLAAGELTLELSDLTGKVLHRQLEQVPAAGLQLEIRPRQPLPQGVLLLTLRSAQGLISRKVVSQ